MKKLLLLSAATVSLLPSCRESAATADTGFARETIISLAKGDSAAQTRIDWPVLTAMGQNVGAEYSAIPTEEEKRKFRQDFINQFATSFRESGGSVDNFANWRVTFSDSTRTEVAADAPGGILRITVSERDATERVSSINLAP